MKVRIIRDDPTSRAEYHVGEVYRVKVYNKNCYAALSSSETTLFHIIKDDCEIIDDTQLSIEERLQKLEKESYLAQEQLRMIDEKIKSTKKTMDSKPKTPRIPDENTPVDTLVRVWEVEGDKAYSCLRYFAGHIEDDFFMVYHDGCTSSTNERPQEIPCKFAEIVEETLEEKRARIFHKFVPEEYKWWAVDPNGKAFYYRNKPSINIVSHRFWGNEATPHRPAGFADPYDWENSLIGRED